MIIGCQIVKIPENIKISIQKVFEMLIFLDCQDH